jgi:hypothetical protein
MMLDSPDFFCEEEFNDCPVSADEREEAQRDMPWKVFTTIAHALKRNGCSPDKAVEELADVAGMNALRFELKKRFFDRSHLLRCFRIVSDARRQVDSIKYNVLATEQSKALALKKQLDGFIQFVSTAPGDDVVKNNLVEYLSKQQGLSSKADDLRKTVEELDGSLARAYHVLADNHADFEALLMVEKNPDDFDSEEKTELEALFGAHGITIEARLPDGKRDVAFVEQRADNWASTQRRSRGERRTVAELATKRYEVILDELLSKPQTDFD